MEQGLGPRVWQFGSVEVDEASATVRIGGSEQSLDRSSYDVLLALLRNHGEVVTRNELLEAGWPGRVVSENSLSKAISRLRHLLGPDAAALRVVHGYGYRLSAAVESTAANANRAATPATTVAPAAAPGATQHDASLRLQPGDPLPSRPGWTLGRRLGEGAAGVIFQAGNQAGETRAVKFSTSEAGLRTLKREVSLSRYLQSRRDVQQRCVPVLGWNLASPPFFLELPYLEGGNLRDWAAARGGLAAVQLEERIGLAIALCEAVAALHSVGLIHRDLKPENVYPVPDPDGTGMRVLLADLGSSDASATAQLAALGITMTLQDSTSGERSGRYPGSLLYIAPEVVAGEAPTQRSDVFALGLLAMQLVVGDLRHSLAPGWERDVADPLIREDVALACASNPDRRAVDAAGLAARLAALPARHRAREAELARAAEEREHERRAIRDRGRRRVLLAVSAALALGLAAASVMYADAESARREAERAAMQRQVVLDFVTDDLLGQADPYRNPEARPSMPLLEAVDRAARTVDRRLDDPAAAAAVHALVADIYFAQDRHADAIAEFHRARALYRGLGADHAGELVRVETGLCDVQRIAGALAEAEEACTSALAHAGKAGNGARDLATLKMGQLRGEQGAEQASLALLRPLLDADAFAGQPRLRGELYWALGLAERGLGRYREAQRHFEALLALDRGPGAPDTWTAWALNSLGSILVSTGDFDAAEETLVKARDLFRASQGSGQVEAQMPNIWRGEIRLRRREWDEAARMQQALLDAWRPTLRPDHPLVLKAEANLAWAQAEAGRDAPAREGLARVLGDAAVAFAPGPGVATRAMRWARAAFALGDGEATDALLAIADEHLAQEFPEHHPVTAEAACMHARRALQREDHRTAHAQAATCAQMLAAYVPEGHPLAEEAQALLVASDGAATPARPESAHSPAGRSGP